MIVVSTIASMAAPQDSGDNVSVESYGRKKDFGEAKINC